ncbi:nitrous oxide reductase accessory protein NosL [Halomonas sp. 11-S5]|uniref:nitrous oxide reductase accessory protein NosL n=1 Tax=Halomonas sp. 11-S5 TaxID=2994064 RepID=UPI0024695E44|nr:nitrous oxide reductase accessory protein NosL [Halomonas sp. 11-S5]
MPAPQPRPAGVAGLLLLLTTPVLHALELEQVCEGFPGAERLAAAESQWPVSEVRAGDELLGYAFESVDVAPCAPSVTMNLFAFLKQPENETRLSHAYVHDIGVTSWGKPSDEAFILASDAWYVVGHDRRGSMGHTLASFAEQADAEAFREAHGGELVVYDDITLDLLGRLGRGELGGDVDQGMGGMPDHD